MKKSTKNDCITCGVCLCLCLLGVFMESIEDFLRQNKEFDGKSSAVQYLVDMNIAQANIKEGCKKIDFIDTTIKDAYLEKFKIYCLVFNNKNSQAQLLLDLLREQHVLLLRMIHLLRSTAELQHPIELLHNLHRAH